MGYGKVKERWTAQGCRVIIIRTVFRKDFIEDDKPCGSLLTPVEHIFLECPDDEENLS
jgi:hypothetical protein